MRELPLLACDRVALALGSGRQTQHRVPMRPQPSIGDSGVWYPDVPRKPAHRARHYANEAHFRRGVALDFAPWQPGDVLYVRECHAFLMPTKSGRRESDERIVTRPEDGESVALWYRASGSMGIVPRVDPEGPRWSPSIHMPKWAARTWLKVTRSWAEESSEWTEEVARAEGFESLATFQDFMRAAYGSILPRWWWACELDLDRARSGVTT